MRKSLFIICGLAVVLCLAGSAIAAPLIRLYVEPGHINLRANMQQKFKVYGLDMFDNEIPVTEPLTWSTQTNAGTITTDGQFTAGTTTGKFMQGVKVTTPSGLTGIALVTVSALPAQGGYVWEKAWGNYIPGELTGEGKIIAGPNGTILVNQTGAQTIQQYDKDGRYVNQIGPLYKIPDGWYMSFMASDGEYIYAGRQYDIVKFNNAGNVVATIGSGASGGQFLGVRDMTCDKDKNLFVVDGGSRILKVSPTGSTLRTFGSAGTGDGQFGEGWLSICTDPAGNLYVGDYYNNRIQKFSSNGVFLAKWTTYGPDNLPINRPGNLVSDSQGNIYFNVSYGNVILKLSSTDAKITSIPTNADLARNASYIDSDGNFYTIRKLWQTEEASLVKYNPQGTMIAEWGKPHRGGLINPSGLAVSPDGNNIYVSDTNRWDVRKFDSNCSRLATWKHNSAVTAVRVDALGNVYACDMYGVKKYSSSGAILKELAVSGTPGGGQWIEGVGIAPNGDMFVAASQGVYRYNTDWQQIALWPTSGTGTGQIAGSGSLAIDQQSNVYLVDGAHDRVQKFDVNGNYITQWSGGMRIPGGICLSPSGSLFVAELGNDSVHKFSTSGIAQGTWGSVGRDNGQFYGLVDVAVDGKDNVYTLDQANKRIDRYVPIIETTSRAKELKDGEFVALSNQIVTANTYDLGDCIYIEAADRSCGIRVTGVTSSRGYHVTVMGTLTTVNGERTLKATSLVSSSFAPLTPLALTNKALGGGDLNYDPQTGIGQRGVEDGAGANNIGLLVKTSGKVTGVGSDFFYIDDGTHAHDGSIFVGVKVQCRKLVKPTLGAVVTVTGVSRINKIGDRYFRCVSARIQSDIVVTP